MTLTEKVAYLKGLAEGMNLDKDAKETKLFECVVDILEDMAGTVTELDEDLAEVEDYVDEIDEDLGDVESLVYDDECDCCCGDETYEVECPSCGEDIVIDESALDAGEVACPNCGDKFALGFDMDDLTDDE